MLQSLPSWFESLWNSLCELPDRTSPEDEPAAITVTRDELSACVLESIGDDIGTCLRALVVDHAMWSQVTFGDDEVLGPIGPLRHLGLEAAEAVNAAIVGDLTGIEDELADCLLLLLDASRRGGVTLPRLIHVAGRKLQINKQRQWPAPPRSDWEHPLEHIRHPIPVDGRGTCQKCREKVSVESLYLQDGWFHSACGGAVVFRKS